jgi:hypothetical protein
MGTSVSVKGECMNRWKDFKTGDIMSVSQFADDNEVMEVVQSLLKATPKSFFLQGIRKLADRWTKYVAKQGDYVKITLQMTTR